MTEFNAPTFRQLIINSENSGDVFFLPKIITLYQVTGCQCSVWTSCYSRLRYITLRYHIASYAPVKLYIYLHINHSVMQHTVPVSQPVNSLIGRTQTIKTWDQIPLTGCSLPGVAFSFVLWFINNSSVCRELFFKRRCIKCMLHQRTLGVLAGNRKDSV